MPKPKLPFPFPERELRYAACAPTISLRESPADDDEEDDDKKPASNDEAPTRASHNKTVETVRGYAALFNTKSSDLGGFIERIDPHAFDEVDLEDSVVALFNHDPSLILARSGGANATLRLGTDERGLWYEFTPPNSPNGQNLAEALRRGDITQSSFGFSIRSGEGEEWDWVEDEEGREHAFRTIKKIARLYDVSPVTYPAYPDTSVAARSLEAVQKTKAAQSPHKTPPPLTAHERALLRRQSA